MAIFKSNKNNKIFICLFILYIVLIFLFVVIKIEYPSDIDFIKESRENGFWNINIVPFRSIRNDITDYSVENIYEIVHHNLTGNIIVYIPFGLLLPLAFKNYDKFTLFITTSIGFITFTEILQFVFMLGYFDIDDIMLNASGCIIGFILYIIGRRAICHMSKNKKRH